MSSYRDDTQETAVASDHTWLKVTAVAEETAKAVSVALFGLLVLHVNAAAAADEVIDSVSYVVDEQALAVDTVSDQLAASVVLNHTVMVHETIRERLAVLHTDAAQIADEVADYLRVVTAETAHLTDQVIAQRRVSEEVTEQAHAIDTAFSHVSILISEEVTASDHAGGQLHAVVAVAESATLGDLVLDARQATVLVTEEQAVAASLVLDGLHAADLVSEVAVSEDWAPPAAGAGQAWTANGDTWAMSRYSPYPCSGLVVIDGALHIIADDGIYRAGVAEDEVIAGRIRTGKLDLGQGGLVHPIAAYLEYQLTGGTASLDVTTTQTGVAQTYNYALPDELADELTNGRFTLGRGLRGRHFGFELNLTGTRGQINDLRVESAPTKRRV